MLAELALRYEPPFELKIALIILLLVLGLFYGLIPGWIRVQTTLAALPFQKFDWESEAYTKNLLLRISSIATVSIIFSIFTYSYVHSNNLQIFSFQSYNYLAILLVVVSLTVVKFFVNRLYFSFHKKENLGQLIIDYQYSINVLFCVIISLIMVFDVFYLRMSDTLFLVNGILILGLFLVKLFGTILLLQNKHNYPLVTVFIYLCTLEIVPMLIIAKFLFVNS